MAKLSVLLADPSAPTVDSVVHRKSVFALDGAEVNRLRKAFAAVHGISDSRGYQHYAGIHWAPNTKPYCQHGTDYFSIWHRPYIAEFEKALQDQVPGVALAYWDWSSPQGQATGIPNIFSEQTYTDEKGATLPNSLYRGVLEFPDAPYPFTTRGPHDGVNDIKISEWLELPRLVDDAMNETDAVGFSYTLENPHNKVHDWTGGNDGTMSDPRYAAYDPIFWFHHANVDRILFEWQAAHRDLSPPVEYMNHPLAPFQVKVSDVWDISKIGYDYVAELRQQLNLGSTMKVNAFLAAPTASQTPIATFDLTKVEDEFDKAELRLEGVEHPADSFTVRVFVNQPGADVGTQTIGNPNFAGSFTFFGHHECLGEEGHCDPTLESRGKFDIRAPHHLTPMQMRLHVTPAIKAARSGGKTALITFVPVDAEGNAMTDPVLKLEAISLITR